eukprot:GHVU01086598.1.p1 GENE.GHVU01086598.1~~GHVU01086598.1.p1  ORF type:complete len:397 (+),score=40.98 GHVU01086598.1:158-1348(+)
MATTSDIREFLITIGELKSFERPGIINLRKRYQDRLCKGAACHSFDSQFCGLNTFCVTNDSKPSVLLVIFHGYGGNRYDLTFLATLFFRKFGRQVAAAIVFPEAPTRMAETEWGRSTSVSGSFKWWTLIDVAAWRDTFANNGIAGLFGPYADVPDGLSAAREAAKGTVKEAAKAFNVPLSSVVLCGFSQGSLLALDLLHHLDPPPLMLSLWSSASICRKYWRDRIESFPRTHRRKVLETPMFVSHGNRDMVVPFVMHSFLKRWLGETGYEHVTSRAFNGAHAIPDHVALDGFTVLMRVVESMGMLRPPGKDDARRIVTVDRSCFVVADGDANCTTTPPPRGSASTSTSTTATNTHTHTHTRTHTHTHTQCPTTLPLYSTMEPTCCIATSRSYYYCE